MSGYMLETRNPILSGSTLLVFVFIPLAVLFPPLVFPFLLYLIWYFLPREAAPAFAPSVRSLARAPRALRALRAPPLV